MDATEFNRISKKEEKEKVAGLLEPEDIKRLIDSQHKTIYENWENCVGATDEKIEKAPGDTIKRILFNDLMHSQSDWAYKKYIYNSEQMQKNMYQWDIFICNLGHNIGCEKNKERPVVILQYTRDYTYAKTIIIAPITTTLSKGFRHEVYLSKEQSIKGTYGTIDLSQIRTVSKSRLQNTSIDRLITIEEYGKFCREKDIEFNREKHVVNVIKKKMKYLFNIDI